MLVRFLANGSIVWREDFGALLDDCDGRAVRVGAGDSSWLIRLTKDGVTVSGPGDADAGAVDVAVTVSGAPDGLLIWLWRRSGDEAITTQGDPAVVGKLWQLLGAATM